MPETATACESRLRIAQRSFGKTTEMNDGPPVVLLSFCVAGFQRGYQSRCWSAGRTRALDGVKLVTPDPAFSGDFRTRQLHKTGRIGHSGGRIVRKGHEGAAEAHAAGARELEIELHTMVKYASCFAPLRCQALPTLRKPRVTRPSWRQAGTDDE